MSISDHKCPACNAELKFNPKSQLWKCEYCGKEYSLEALKNIASKSKKGVSNTEYNRISLP